MHDKLRKQEKENQLVGLRNGKRIEGMKIIMLWRRQRMLNLTTLFVFSIKVKAK